VLLQLQKQNLRSWGDTFSKQAGFKFLKNTGMRKGGVEIVCLSAMKVPQRRTGEKKEKLKGDPMLGGMSCLRGEGGGKIDKLIIVSTQ